MLLLQCCCCSAVRDTHLTTVLCVRYQQRNVICVERSGAEQLLTVESESGDCGQCGASVAATHIERVV